jgi:hypothetical protein
VGHAIVARRLDLPIDRMQVGLDVAGKADIGNSDHFSVLDQLTVWVAGLEGQRLAKCEMLRSRQFRLARRLD